MGLNQIEYISVIGLIIVIGLIFALLYIYMRNYRVVRINYGLVLILLASILLIYNIFQILELWLNLDHSIDIILLFEVIIEIIVFSIILKISLDH
jgi:hypothetical protein